MVKICHNALCALIKSTLAVVICFQLVGCNKQAVQDTPIKDVSPSDVAYYHSFCLKKLLADETLAKPITFEEGVNAIADILLKEGFDKQTVEQSVQDISDLNKQEVFGKNFELICKVNSNNANLLIDRVNAFLVENKVGSDKFQADFIGLLSYKQNHSIDETLAYANNVFALSNYQLPSERNAALIANSVLCDSYDFWNVGRLKAFGDKDYDWIYLNDAIGGVLGTVFGGVGSVVVGSFFSWGTARELDGEPIVPGSSSRY